MLNRSLAALSFVVVGALTLAFNGAADRATTLIKEGDKGERERDLRSLSNDLSRALRPDALLERASSRLLELLNADAVVITGLDGDRFAAPRISSPEETTFAAPGTLASWALDALPVTDTPVITVRSDEGVMSVGRLRQTGADDLIVVAAHPKVNGASVLLGEALKTVEPLLERAKAFAALEKQV